MSNRSAGVRAAGDRVVADLDFGLTAAQRQQLSAALEALIEKYGGMARSTSKPVPMEYFNAVVDGLNSAYKLLNGIEDDDNNKETGK